MEPVSREFPDINMKFKNYLGPISVSLVVGFLFAVFSGINPNMNVLFLFVLAPFLLIIFVITVLAIAFLLNSRKVSWAGTLLTGFVLAISINLLNIAVQPVKGGHGSFLLSNYQPSLLQYYLGNPANYATHLSIVGYLAIGYALVSVALILVKKNINKWLIILPGIILVLYAIFL